ncbi:glycosyltransferase N-terminal domain-containing protein, partial [Arsukibacterium sp.]|uniref:glycosyltransferase N-terminal domain-containing protein n=1 Tax=Arsukibacterium sp. TaxID=1977258 RepID=UPI003FA55837
MQADAAMHAVVKKAFAKHIPKILVNARLSARSERRYQLVRPFAAALFNQLDTICVQEPAD